jgi:bifunctional pyridoxal-dependent enzyme with beta-cystathionase and maltose regulon repressor activities
VAFHILLNSGDEAVISEPAWFCYEPMLLAADAVPRKVKLKVPTFDLDLSAIEAAIGPKTRLVIVNTPHNPTGRIYENYWNARRRGTAIACFCSRTNHIVGCALTAAALQVRHHFIRGH